MNDKPRSHAGDERPEPRPQLPRTERDEAPLYLARYLERRRREDAAAAVDADDDTTPLYLRSFRERRKRTSRTN